MSSFFDKLMLARQVSFKEGRVEMLENQRLLLFPMELAAFYTADLLKDTEGTKELYRTGKECMLKGFVYNTMKSHGPTSRKDLLSLLSNIASFAGWGVYRYEMIDEKNHKILMNMWDCLVSDYLKGKVDAPCDHIFRGFIAGGASVVFGREMECIESECIAIGDSRCHFTAATKEELEKEFPKFFGRQV